MKFAFPPGRFVFLMALLGLALFLQPALAEAQRPIKVGILDTYTRAAGGVWPGCPERFQTGLERDQ